MKALVFHGAQDIRYEEMADPVLIDPNGAIVRPRYCGICGSDLHMFQGHTTLNVSGQCIGHEAVGEVVEIGRDVRTLKVGDEVMLSAGVGCGKCPPCLAGRINLCRTGGANVYGLTPALQGCQAEAIWVPEADTNARRLPEGITAEQGLLLTDNLPTAWFGCLRADIRPGEDVAVVGLGPIGLMAVECAFVMGAARVFALDLIAERRALAEAMGATALDPADPSFKAAFAELTKGRGVPAVVEAVGSDATLRTAIHLAGIEGTISAVGVSNNQAFPFPMLTGFARNLTFRIGGCAVQLYWDELISLLQRGRIRPERFITHRLALDAGPDAYRRIDRREGGIIKAVLTPAG